MIHHYFGNKQGLFDEIIKEFKSSTFDVPLRLINKPPQSAEEFRLRLEMFISETFRALVAQATVFRILVRESCGFVGIEHFHEGFGAYLKQAQEAGFIRQDLRADLVTGIVLDRLGNQIMYAATMPDEGTNVLNDETFAEEWLAANVSVLTHGLAG